MSPWQYKFTPTGLRAVDPPNTFPKPEDYLLVRCAPIDTVFDARAFHEDGGMYGPDSISMADILEIGE